MTASLVTAKVIRAVRLLVGFKFTTQEHYAPGPLAIASAVPILATGQDFRELESTAITHGGLVCVLAVT